MSRSNLEILKQKYPGRVIVPGFLRKDVALVNGNTIIKFPVLKNDNGQPLQTENFLDTNDAFAVERYGLYLLFETVGSEGTGVLQTYPNATVFTGTGLTAADLEKIYNGSFAGKIGQYQLIEAYPTKNFRVVRTTQQATSTTKSESLPVDGTAEASPLLVFGGCEKLELQVQRPTGASDAVQLTTTTTNIVKAVLFLQGYTIYGAGYDAVIAEGRK